MNIQHIKSSIANDEEWNVFINSSPQGGIIANSHFLNTLGRDFMRYVYKSENGEILAGALLCQTNIDPTYPCSFLPYQGIMYSRKISCQVNHKRISDEFKITKIIINDVLQRHLKFQATLSPYFFDLRPFTWHNYHEENGYKFEVSLKYTAILDLQNFELNTYLGKIRSVRRREYRNAKVVIENTKDVNLFIKLYIKTFQRQSIELRKEVISTIERICKTAIELDYGFLTMAIQDNEVVSMNFFIHDADTAYYLFGANNPEKRSGGGSVALLISNIDRAAKMGIRRVDFVGVNSPNRGDFKLSFGGELTPYCQVQCLAGV